MLFTILFLVAFSFVAEGHMHVSGVPMGPGNHFGPHRRLFVPIDPNFCNAQAQQAPISCFQSNVGGTAYCSSFLGIPTVTVCTTATVAPAAGTTTITSILGQTPVTIGPITKRADIIKEAPVVEDDAPKLVRRHMLQPRQVAGCVPATQSAPYSSSVCSCLNIPTPTTTTTFTYTPPPTATQIVVITPSASQVFTTINSFYTGTIVATSTIAPALPGQPFTVVVYSPQLYTTITNLGSATTFTQVTQTAAGIPGTVVVQVAAIYTTVSLVGAATTSTQFVATIAGQTGTVVVQVPPIYTTVTSVAAVGSVATTFTQLTATNIGQIGTVVVQLPPLQTVTTTTYGTNTVGFTSTVTTVVGSATSLVAVVGIPVTPFHIFVTDANANPFGYLDVVGAGIGGTYNMTLSNFTDGALFYFSTATGQLALSPASGVSAVPLYSVQNLIPGSGPLQLAVNNPTTNTPVTAALYPDGTIRIGTGTQNTAVAVYICNGVLTIGSTDPSCVQAFLTPTRSNAVYVTTTTTIGSTSSVRTSAATGSTVSNNGTVTSTVPTAVPTALCTAAGFNYIGYTNPFFYPSGSATTNPFYIGFNSTYFANAALPQLFSGTWTGNANYQRAGGVAPLYNTPNVDNSNLTVIYRGYFVVPTTGTWQLNMPSGADDISYFWIGTAADGYGWGETNYNLRATYQIPARNIVSFNFIAGKLYPMVMLSGNGQEVSALTIVITNPAGANFTDTTGFFYQPSCASLAYLSASPQPSVTGCVASGIEYIARPNPTTTVITTTTLTTPLFQTPRLVTATATVTRTFTPDQYTSPAASPYSLVNYNGVVRDLTLGSANAPDLVYGRGPYDFSQVVTFLRGFFLPNVTGSYTFTLNQPDDIGWMWIGTKAINGWGSTNADVTAAQVNGPSLSTVQVLTAGVPLPIRMAFANQGGGYSYALTVRDPNGLTKTNTFGMFLQPMCGTTPYAQWT